MSLLQGSDIQSSVYICTFVCLVREADISMKFPCTYYIEWTTTGGKTVAKTSKHKPEKNHVSFNQKISLTTEMIFNHKTQEYAKKDALIELFLVSKSRPDQNKLVGRVTIDLGKIINVQMYAEPTEFKLNFCSVDASLTMQFMLVEQKLTSMKVQDLDRSSFIDYISHVSLKNQKNVPQTIKVQDTLLNQRLKSSNNDQVNLHQTSIDKEMINKSISVKEQLANGNRNDGIFKEKQKNESNIEKPIRQNQGNKRITFGHQYLLQSNACEPEKTEKVDKIKEQVQELGSASFQMNNINVNPLKLFDTQKLMENLPTSLLNEDRSQFEQQQQVKRKQKKLISIQQAIAAQSQKEQRNDFSEEISQIKFQMQRKMLELRREFSVKEQSLMELNQQYLKDIESKNETNNELNRQLQMQSLQCKKLELLVEQKENILKTIQSQKEEQTKKNQEIIEKYQSELQQVDFRIETYSQEIQKLNNNLLEEESRTQAYEQKFLSLEQTIKNLQDKLAKQEQQKIKQETIDGELRNVIQQLQSEIQSYKNHKTKQTEFSISLPNDEISALKSKEIEYERKIKQLEAELDVTLQQYEQKNDEFQQLSQKHNSILEQQSRQKTNPSEEIESLTRQLTQAQEEINKLNSQLEFLRISLEMSEKQSKDLTQEIEIIRNQNQDNKAKLQQLQIRCIDLESQLSSTSLMPPSCEIKPDDEEKNQLEEELMGLSTLLEEEKIKNSELIFLNEKYSEKINFLEETLSGLEKQNIKLKEEVRIINQKVQSQTLQKRSQEQDLFVKHSDYEQKIRVLNISLQQKINLNTELSETVIKFMDKQAKMKETLSILEDESKQIFILFQQKEHNEETYQKMIEDLQRQIQRMKINFNEIHSEESSPTKSIYQSPKTPQIKLHQQAEESLSNIKNINFELQDELQKLKISYSLLKHQNESLQQIKSDFQRLKLEYNVHCSNEAELRNSLENVKHAYQTQIQALTQQLTENNSKSQETRINSDKEIERAIKSKEIELQIMKKREIEYQQYKSKIEGDFQELKMELQIIQEEKFDLQSSNNEKEIKIFELQQTISNLTSHLQSLQQNQPQSQGISHEKLGQMYSTFTLIKDKILMSNMSTQWDELMKNILQRSLLGGEEISKIINIEEKSRLLSKELQKLKAQIIKSSSRNQQEKLNLMGMIKKCDEIISELVAAAESLNLNQSSFL